MFAPWTFPAVPNFGGSIIASDASVIFDGATYTMFYTDLDPNNGFRTVIDRATSTDGKTWTPEGIVLFGNQSGDQQNLEAAGVFKVSGLWHLLYSTYGDAPPGGLQVNTTLRLATSIDGVNFTKQPTPALTRTVGWYDNDLIFSPTVVPYLGGWLMIYCGHCYTNASRISGQYGVYLLTARSTNGVTWTKQPAPSLRSVPSIPWMSEGAAEPCLIIGPDGRYYLFFTGLSGGDRVVGMASTHNPLWRWSLPADPLGSWAIPGPTLLLTDPVDILVAPEVKLAGNIARMWITRATPANSWTVDYAESTWS